MSSGESSDPNFAQEVETAHAADVALLRAKQEEEDFARLHSMPTRLLGWMLIAGFVLQLISGLTRSTVDLSGIVFLIAGSYVLRGSQTWLRLVISFCSLALLGLAKLIWTAVRGEPLAANHHWHFVNQPGFWVYGVSPMMYLLGEGILGIVALKARRLCFWTKPYAIAASLCGVAILGIAGFELRDWNHKRIVAREMAAEIAAARAYITYRPSPKPHSRATANTAFSSLPQIQEIRWWWISGACDVIYQRGPDNSFLVPRAGKPYQYTEWTTDGSGLRGHLEIVLLVPEHE
jgi:hypothetical protein